MKFFPQLNSGALAQFPWRKTIRFRTIRNQPLQGPATELGDDSFEERMWELPLSELEDDELQRIRTLFEQCGGRVGGFTFLEPGSNLLAWSEDLTAAVWQGTGGVQTTAGLADPEGGTEAFQLTSAAAFTLGQTLTVDASQRYIASVWARTSDADCRVRISDGAAPAAESEFSTTGAWQRYRLLWNIPSSAQVLTLEFSGEAGATLDLFGPQLQGQIQETAYLPTAERNGVYPQAHFDHDTFGEVLTGVGRTAGTVRILWTPSPI